MQQQPKRTEVPVEKTWNLDDLFPTMESWERAFEAVEAALPSISAYQGRLASGGRALLSCLDSREELLKALYRVGTFAHLRLSEDGSNTDNQGLAERAGSLGARVGAAAAFIRSEILQLPENALREFYDQEPGLEVYRPYLDELNEMRQHMLHPETEAALAALSETLGAPMSIYNRGKSSDMKFPSIRDSEERELEISFAQYEDNLEQSPDTETRRRGFSAFSAGLKSFQNTFAATFSTEIKRNVAMARLRKFDSAEQMLTHPHRITFEAYEIVLNVIQAELAPHMRRYQQLRKKVLGLDRLLHCDLKAPLDPEYNPPVTYSGATELLLDALSVLGPEYGEAMKRGLTERWVDLANNVGKSTGAFCSSPYGVHSYILITWTDHMRSVFVLAHELGHAGHFALAQKYQKLTNTRPSMYCIEAPSTSNELILADHILRGTSDTRMRRWVILQLMGTFHHNFVTHLLEGELQRRVYRLAEAGEPLTAAALSEQKGEVFSSFFGDVLEVDEGARLTWMRQPHYYMGLYPYTYSAGLCAAVAVVNRIKHDGAPAVENWLRALKAGGTLPPLELMKLAGVDMSTPEPMREAVRYVGTLVDELERGFAPA